MASVVLAFSPLKYSVVNLPCAKYSTYKISPADVGLEQQSLDGLSVDSAQASAELIRGALKGSDDPAAQKAAAIIAFNAGATIYVAGIAATLADGVALAEDLLASGQAAEKMKSFIDFTQLMRG